MQYIPLTRGKLAIIDDEDYQRVSQLKWQLIKTGRKQDREYAVHGYDRHSNSKKLYMHRFIMNTPQGYDTDHINFNGLDNRKCNLRIVTRGENTMHKQIPKRGQYSYVYWFDKTKRWVAKPTINGRQTSVAYFKTETFAALAVLIIYHFRKYYFG